MIKWKPTEEERKRIHNTRLAFVLTKDSERILIGSAENIRMRLEGREAAVDVDVSRPFGTYLLTFDTDKAEDWKYAISHLKDAQKIIHRTMGGTSFLKSATIFDEQAKELLTQKYNTGDPINQYVAMRIWFGYWLFREKKAPEECELFLESMENLIRPFCHSRIPMQANKRITFEDPIFLHMKELTSYDREQTIYSVEDPMIQEYIVADKSLIPVEKYYASKVESWKKYIIECKICNKPFIADSLRYELCSDECREQSRRENLAARNERGNTKGVDKICIGANAHWNNRLSQMRKSCKYSEEQLKQYETAKKRFQNKKRKKRQAYKKGKISFEELRDWLLEQEEEARLTKERLMVTKR